MRKQAAIIFALVLIANSALARPLHEITFFQRVQLGMELGYTQTFYKYRHYNIVSEQGYRINEVAEGFFLHPNGDIMVNIGYDVTDKLNIAMYSGYAGVCDNRRMFPILFRGSYFPKTIWDDGFFAYAEIGIGISSPLGDIYNNDIALMSDAGGGFRIKLTPYYNLDFMISLKATFDDPPISNPDGDGYVLYENVRSNDATYCALTFSVAINF